MKYLIFFLVCSFLTVFAYADDDVVHPGDPNMAEYNSYTQATVVDQDKSFATTQSEYFKVPTPQVCPACNLQGSINLVDENGTPVVAGSGGASGTGNGGEAKSLGQ